MRPGLGQSLSWAGAVRLKEGGRQRFQWVGETCEGEDGGVLQVGLGCLWL